MWWPTNSMILPNRFALYDVRFPQNRNTYGSKIGNKPSNVIMIHLCTSEKIFCITFKRIHKFLVIM